MITCSIIFLLYLLALRGRKRHPLLRRLRKWNYAHRGLHGGGVPENSMEAFRLAIENGYGFELDVHLLADGNLAVIHDSSLMRTAGADVLIEDLTTEQLQDYRLEGSNEPIPTFREVLDLCGGKVPMVVEIKSYKDNHADVTAKTCEMLEKYEGLYCVESFDPRCIRWLKVNRPDFVRGQLAHNSMFEAKGQYPFLLRLTMTNLLSNFWNAPDFISYRFCDRKRLSVWLARKLWKIQGVTWTLKTKEDFDVAVQEGWIPIFEGFKP